MKNAWRYLSPPSSTATVHGAVAKALRSGNWAYGQRAKTLERQLARMADVPPEWVIATDSCTSALRAAGRWLTNRTGRLPVCPLTWPSTYSWHDCEYGWRWEELGSRKVVVHTQLWGRPGIPESAIIIDCAHRFMSADALDWIRGGEPGAVCFSFAPQKEIASFQGGAIISPEADEMRVALQAGQFERAFMGVGAAHKGLISDVAAAMVMEQLKRKDYLYGRRQIVLEEYERHLGGMLLTKPGEASGHLAVLDCGSSGLRKLIVDAFSKQPSIQWNVHHRMNHVQRKACPKTAELEARIISVPCHAEMTRYDVRKVCQRVLSA